jgi:hypothetical protein
VLCLSGSAISQQLLKEKKTFIYSNQVNITPGNILFVKRENIICAIKFRDSVIEFSNKDRNNFDPYKDIMRAKYEVHVYKNTETVYILMQTDVGEISHGPTLGKTRAFSLSPYNKERISCGNYFQLHGNVPNGVGVVDNKEIDKFEFAPTGFRMWSDVNFIDKRIRWYKLVNYARETIAFEVNDLIWSRDEVIN